MTTDGLEGVLLPPGACLVHIGPSKTGTTSLQAAMWAARRDVQRQGVHYAGRSRHSGFAARAVAGRKSAYSDEGKPPPMRHWDAIVREVARISGDRVLFSSEFLAHAEPPAIRKVIEDLGKDRVHVAVTLRPLPKMLSSRWQQDVQSGSTMAYEGWLESHLGREGAHPEVQMWTAHRHDRLVQAWGEVVGMDRVTAVVVDEKDHAFLLRAFEVMLGIRPGTLQLQDDYENRSLMLDEVEAIRALNIRFKQMGIGRGANTILVRNGAARTMKLRRPGPDERKVVTPRWAVERAAEIAVDVVAGIRASGAHVIGDLDSLLVVPDASDALVTSDGRLSIDAAVAMAVGAVRSSGALPPVRKRKELAEADRRALDSQRVLPMLGDRDIVRLLLRRKRGEATRFLKAIRGQGGADA